MRIRLAQLHQSGAVDGDSPVWDDTLGTFVARGAGAPSGSAGGDLAGTYPNPTIGPAGMEAIRDMLASVITAGTNVTVTVNDAGDTITIASTAGYTDEQVRDVIGVALVAGTGISVTVNDAGDTITLAVGTHSHATGDVTSLAEYVRDTIAAALVAGTGMTVTVDDPGDTITLTSTGGYTDENARDAVGAALVAGTGITITVDDTANTITISATGGGGGGSSVGSDLYLFSVYV